MIERLGKLIAAIRRSLGLTQEKFAESMGETSNRVKKVEYGLRKPDITFLSKLRAKHRISVDRLLDKAKEK